MSCGDWKSVQIIVAVHGQMTTGALGHKARIFTVGLQFQTKLFITPSGVSVLIRELERQLGFRLFNRTTRQVELTTYGSELLAATQPSMKALDAAMSRIEQAAKGKTRSISVGTTPWLAAHVLPPAIKGFREQRPDLHIRLFDGNVSTVARRVVAGNLDFGVRHFREDAGRTAGTLFSFFPDGGPRG
jgi:LysR family transcriptional regulator, carnitine catabolism transcriptional activator